MKRIIIVAVTTMLVTSIYACSKSSNDSGPQSTQNNAHLSATVQVQGGSNQNK